MGKKLNLMDEVFGRLTVIGEAPNKGNKCQWLCRCECGNELLVITDSLRANHTNSCGCLTIDTITKHGLRYTKLYRVWAGVRDRCTNPNAPAFKDYGGRGITIDPKWLTYVGFYEDMGDTYQEGLQIERIDNNKGYCKENCKWDTRINQARNTRRNHMITYNGETKCLTDWANDLDLKAANLIWRINHWGVEKALNTPKRVR